MDGRSRLSRRKKDIYKAKGQGFDVKILREVIRIPKKDPAGAILDEAACRRPTRPTTRSVAPSKSAPASEVIVPPSKPLNPTALNGCKTK